MPNFGDLNPPLLLLLALPLSRRLPSSLPVVLAAGAATVDGRGRRGNGDRRVGVRFCLGTVGGDIIMFDEVVPIVPNVDADKDDTTDALDALLDLETPLFPLLTLSLPAVETDAVSPVCNVPNDFPSLEDEEELGSGLAAD